MAAFSDLNIAAGKPEMISDILRVVTKFGYDCVAINTFVPQLVPITKGKKQQDQVKIPPPYRCNIDEETQQHLRLRGKTLQQLTRFSTVLSEHGQTRKLATPEVQEYDILSVQPSCEKTFQLACSTLDIDIISIDMTERFPFYLKRPTVNLAIERGIHFEVKYSPSLLESTMRRNTISNALSLMEVCKGKNIIISSGCERPSELRSPYDVAVLGCLFGLSYAQAKEAITKNCRAVVLHAHKRKMIKSTIAVIKAPLSTPRMEKVEKDDKADESDEPATKKIKT